MALIFHYKDLSDTIKLTWAQMNQNLRSVEEAVVIVQDAELNTAQLENSTAQLRDQTQDLKNSAETTLALVNNGVLQDLPDYTEAGAPLVINASKTGVVFGAGPALYAGSNLADLPNKATARGNLGLGSAATRDVITSITDVTAGRLLANGIEGMGLGGAFIPDPRGPLPNGFYAGGGSSGVGYPHSNDAEYKPFIALNRNGIDTTGSTFSGVRLFFDTNFGTISRIYIGSSNYIDVFPKTNRNTTIDSNGFIKAASPIIKLFNDNIEKTDDLEITETEFERIEVGVYKLTNAPLLSRDGWYIETPKDRNGNVYFTLDYEENDGMLIIRTYEPDYSTGKATNGDPVDIPEGRFISLRFEEDPSLYPVPEMPENSEQPSDPEDTTNPYVPQIISFAQGKRALIRRGYWQAANDFVDSIEDETERLLAQSALHDPQEFHRASPFLNYLAGVLEIPDSEIDEMFIEGAADII